MTIVKSRHDLLWSGERVVMEWVELGKGANKGAEREGFGARLIKFIPSREKNGKVDIENRPEGYVARITFTRGRPRAPRTWCGGRTSSPAWAS